MSSVSQSISDAQRPGSAQTQRTAEAKEAVEASLISAGHTIDAELQTRAKNIHADAQTLLKQEKELQKLIKTVAKESDSSQKILDKSHKELSAFDDLQEIQDGLDDDLADLEAMLDALEGDDFESSDGSYKEPIKDRSRETK